MTARTPWLESWFAPFTETAIDSALPRGHRQRQLRPDVHPDIVTILDFTQGSALAGHLGADWTGPEPLDRDTTPGSACVLTHQHAARP